MQINIQKEIQEYPCGVTQESIAILKRVFAWQKATPGEADKNKEAYLQMSGWYDVIDFLEAIAKAQSCGNIQPETTGAESVGVLSRLKKSNNPILQAMHCERGK